jgi:UDPglucose 6-dehydrogenase
VTGTCFAEFGVDVTCIDNDTSKIDMLTRGKIPIYEPGLQQLVEKNIAEGRLHFTSDIREGVEKALVIFIAVGTPPLEDGSADLSYVDEVAQSIGRSLNGYKVVATKSTVPIGTGERITEIIGNLCGDIAFDVVSNPEFLREGSAIEDFMRPNRIVIGADSEQADAIMRDLYAPLFLMETPIVSTNVASAEMIKYASNAFLATKISFINDPGTSYGGWCFPKDTRALVRIATENGYDIRIVQAVLEVNSQRREAMLAKIRSLVPDLEGKTVAILGLSFKPNTDDIRESPAIDICKMLTAAGAYLRVFDPAALEEARRELGEENVYYASDTFDTADGADLLVILTEWNLFRKLDLVRLKSLLRAPMIVDCRNIYEPRLMKEAGFEYLSVGR